MTGFNLPTTAAQKAAYQAVALARQAYLDVLLSGNLPLPTTPPQVAAYQKLLQAENDYHNALHTTPVPPAPTPTPTPTPTPAPTSAWKSGAGGDGIKDGSFAAWRKRPVDIGGTWADVQDKNTGWIPMLDPLDILPGGVYATWQGDLDMAIGAINLNQDVAGNQKYGPKETWADAAAGAYDARWTQALTAIAQAWHAVLRKGKLYLRFAHEFNGDWYGWQVRAADTDNFVAAWKRFRALQQQLFPDAKLVWCPNWDTVTDVDIRKAFPGKAYVDVIGVDYYNTQWNRATDASSFAAAASSTESNGAPRGPESYRQFALAQGLPLAFCEWGTAADQGDAPGFMDAFHDWLALNAGTGAGQVLYEIYFNVTSYGGNNYGIYPVTRQSAAAARYALRWSAA